MNGKPWIVTSRHKTGISNNIPLLDIPQKILKKYEGKDEKERLLPVPSNQNMNAYLKEIADVCGVKKNLTCHGGKTCICHTDAKLRSFYGIRLENVRAYQYQNNYDICEAIY